MFSILMTSLTDKPLRHYIICTYAAVSIVAHALALAVCSMCLPFDSCWIYIKPSSKRSGSPFIGVVAAVDSRFEFPKTIVDSGSCDIYSKAR